MNRETPCRNVFRSLQDSPMFPGCVDRSPMTSLANTLLEASLASTPWKRLSLSSTLTDTPQSPRDKSLSRSSNTPISRGTSPDSCAKSSPSSVLSSPRNKENLPLHYYSPSHGRIARQFPSPLREVQNTVTRNLSFSPLKKPISPARREHHSPIKKPTPPDDCDSTSRDSGYSESGQKRDGFCVPRSCAPTRRLNLDMSPLKSPCEVRKARSFASLRKKSEEDAFLMEFICGGGGELFAEEDDSPSSSLSSLFSAPIQASQASSVPTATPSGAPASSRTSIKATTPIFSPNVPRLPIRRCLSMVDASTPLSSRIKYDQRNSIGTSQKKDSIPLCSSFKRPQSPSVARSPADSKRRKMDTPTSGPVVLRASVATAGGSPKAPLAARHFSDPEPIRKEECGRPKFQRCHSESHVSIMKALSISSSLGGELTGDFTQPLSLPTIQGAKHPDLKSISIHTMAALLQGGFKDSVGSFKVLDCRYPYEYEGGHIVDALNWHHPKMVQEYLNEQKDPPKISSPDAPRNILIFHCEFSAERGPRAQRMLREIDRTANKEHYPALHFPELYLLEGGYKAFFEEYPELCSPADYVKMLDEKHSEVFKFFRHKSKSWAAENKQSRGSVSRTGGPKRLRV